MAEIGSVTAGTVLVREALASWTTVGDVVVVYQLATNEACELNASAGLMWQCLDGTATLGEIAVDLAAAFERSLVDVHRECVEFGRDMVGRRLACVPGHPTASAVTHPGPDPEPRQADPGPPGRGHHRLGPYAALDHRFVIDAPAPVATRLEPVFASLLAPGRPTVRYRVRRRHGWVVDDGATEIGRCARLGGVADIVQRAINEGAVTSVPAAAVLHAGAVVWEGGGILLPGASGAGKSTLVAALVRAGADYLSDEAAVIDATGSIRPYPKPVSLRPGSWAWFPDLARRGNDRLLVPPDLLRPDSIGRASPVSRIVFVTGRHDATMTVAPVRPARALLSLLGNWFPSPVARAQAFAALAGIVVSAECVELSGGPLDAVVERLLGPAPGVPHGQPDAEWRDGCR